MKSKVLLTLAMVFCIAALALSQAKANEKKPLPKKVCAVIECQNHTNIEIAGLETSPSWA